MFSLSSLLHNGCWEVFKVKLYLLQLRRKLEDSCSQPADTNKNSDKHEDLSSHTMQQIVVELQLPSFQTLSYDIV